MKILVTGATGYIGKRLIPVLLAEGHHVICCVRDRKRFESSNYNSDSLSVIECDFLDPKSLQSIPSNIDAAYYLIHSMAGSIGNFEEDEKITATNFRDRIDKSSVKQVIYLSGIINNEELSKHLSSRKAVEEILAGGTFPLTTLRAGIIIGSGSASFEIMRDLVEKLPVMITPKWLNTRSQPVAVRNVLQFLNGVLMDSSCFSRSYDIGGPQVMTYKEMLLQFAKVRGLKRWIGVVPIMTPKLSSYWLYFITSTSYKLAVNLVDSMKVEVICEPNDLAEHLGIQLFSFDEAVNMAFERITHHSVISSWTDAQSSNILNEGISHLINVPEHGCYTDQRQAIIPDVDTTMDRIWSIGGSHGWYYANWLWRIRGFLDKINGGVGLRRGRKSTSEISAGDSLDFWRVIYANKKEGRLLLYAEMKLPGEAWLEFRKHEDSLIQTATFRPLGLRGRLYWYSVLPFHAFIFRGMLSQLVAK